MDPALLNSGVSRSGLTPLGLFMAALLVATAPTAFATTVGFQSTSVQERPTVERLATAEDIDELRSQYVLDPDRAELSFIAIRRLENERLRSQVMLSRERLLAELNALSLQTTGEAFLQGSAMSQGMLDSLALAFFWSPSNHSNEGLEHLEFVSRETSGAPFLRGNTGLLKLLRSERTHFFNEPRSFDLSRIKDLEVVSLHVSSLPFLRGSPAITAQLERARMEFRDRPEAFSRERLSDLDYVSRTVQNRPFTPSVPWARIGIGALIVSSLTLWVIASRRKSRMENAHRGKRSAEVETPPLMTVREACAILGVPPDCTPAELTRAYRAMQKQYHPDLVAQLGPEIRQAAELKTRKVIQAYRLLQTRVGVTRDN